MLIAVNPFAMASNRPKEWMRLACRNISAPKATATPRWIAVEMTPTEPGGPHTTAIVLPAAWNSDR